MRHLVDGWLYRLKADVHADDLQVKGWWQQKSADKKRHVWQQRNQKGKQEKVAVETIILRERKTD
jgi:hypothetical protein